MSTATVASKGQITTPVDIRLSLGLEAVDPSTSLWINRVEWFFYQPLKT